ELLDAAAELARRVVEAGELPAGGRALGADLGDADLVLGHAGRGLVGPLARDRDAVDEAELAPLALVGAAAGGGERGAGVLGLAAVLGQRRLQLAALAAELRAPLAQPLGLGAPARQVLLGGQDREIALVALAADRVGGGA